MLKFSNHFNVVSLHPLFWATLAYSLGIVCYLAEWPKLLVCSKSVVSCAIALIILISIIFCLIGMLWLVNNFKKSSINNHTYEHLELGAHEGNQDLGLNKLSISPTVSREINRVKAQNLHIRAKTVSPAIKLLSLRTSGINQYVTLTAVFILFIVGIVRTHIFINNMKQQQQKIAHIKKGTRATVISIDNDAKKPFSTTVVLAIKNIRCAFKLIYPPLLEVGDQISLSALTVKPCSQQNAHWLFTQKLAGLGYVPKLNNTIIKRPLFHWKRLITHIRNRIAQCCAKKMSLSTYTLFSALILGKRHHTEHYFHIKTLCSYWGIIHYLVRAGLHVTFIISLWSIFLKRIALSYFTKQLILTLLISIFALLTWPSIPFLRSFIVLLLTQFCTWNQLVFQPLYVLSLTTLAFLLYNPLSLTTLDFQLSFGITAVIMWFNEIQKIAHTNN